MANTQCVKSVTLLTGENLNGKANHILTVNASGRVVMADAATELVVGVLMEDPGRTNVGIAVPVAAVGGGGVLRCVAGAAISAGQLLVPSATDGQAAGVANADGLAANQVAFGVALEAASAAGEVISFLAMTVAKSAS